MSMVSARWCLLVSLVLAPLLVITACDDPVPGPIGGLILALRSFEATANPDLQAIKSVEILTSHVDMQYSPTAGGTTTFLTVDTQPRSIVILNSGQTDLLIAQYQVPLGFVSQIRIFPRTVTIHLKSGTDVSLGVPSPNLPSWEQSGWKIEPDDGNPWPIQQDQLTGVRVAFHFDAQMLHNKGNGYKILPTAPAALFQVNPAQNAPGWFADQLTIIYKAGITRGQVDAVNAQIGSWVLMAPSTSNAYRIKLPASINLDDAFNFYKTQSTVQAVLPAINFDLTQLNPNEGTQSNQSLCKLPNAWGLVSQLNNGQIGSRQIRIAVIDSGIALNHPDYYQNIAINRGEIPPSINSQLVDIDHDGVISIDDINNPINRHLAPPDSNGNGVIDPLDLIASGSTWSNNVDDDNNGKVDDLVGWNFDGNNNNPDGVGNGHGTLVTGILGAVGNNQIGVAGTVWRTSIIPINVSTTFCTICSVPDIKYFDALSYVEQLGVDIVQVSLGLTLASEHANIDQCILASNNQGQINPAPFLGKTQRVFDDVENEYINSYLTEPWLDLNTRLIKSKSLYVFAAGNSGMNLADSNIIQLPGQPFKSVLGKNVLLVGNCLRTNGLGPAVCDTASPLSNYGPGVVEAWAPGNGWTTGLSPNGGTITQYQGKSISGTSFAAPVVSGTAALILTVHPELRKRPTALHDQITINSVNNVVFSDGPPPQCIMGLPVGAALDSSLAVE